MVARDSQDVAEGKYSQLPFNKYRSNIYSQHGEDGIIAEILRRLDISDTEECWCVEFGAWDGKHLSNTFALVERARYHAVYIEGDPQRFVDLTKTAKEFPSIVALCAYVSAFRGDAASLENLLAKTDIPKEFVLLSIDIDSYDLDVWESLTSYQPKVVVIEINSSVPPGIVWRHGPKTQGNTFSATCSVAKDKGYELVCHTGNLIFVRKDLVGRLDIEERFFKFPELLFLFDTEWFPTGLFSTSSRMLLRRLSEIFFGRRTGRR
jgi:hypothetical protein